MADVKATNVVLVHGGFVDGSGWESVYRILKKDGYVSQPNAVAAIIKKAAGALKTRTN